MVPAACVTIAGETLELLPERAAFWRRRATLYVADLHLGKGAVFARQGRAVPTAAVEADLSRLSRAITATNASRLVILGDLFHARAGMVSHTLSTLAAWRAQHATLNIDLIRGNHDAHAGDPPAALNFRCANGPVTDGPWAYAHEPDDPHNDTTPHNPYRLGGHLHPVARLLGPGGTSLRAPCFVVGTTRLVMPAFATFTGGGPAGTRDGDRVLAIAGDEVIEVPVVRIVRATGTGARAFSGVRAGSADKGPRNPQPRNRARRRPA